MQSSLKSCYFYCVRKTTQSKKCQDYYLSFYKEVRIMFASESIILNKVR